MIYLRVGYVLVAIFYVCFACKQNLYARITNEMHAFHVKLLFFSQLAVVGISLQPIKK